MHRCVLEASASRKGLVGGHTPEMISLRIESAQGLQSQKSYTLNGGLTASMRLRLRQVPCNRNFLMLTMKVVASEKQLETAISLGRTVLCQKAMD